MYTLEKFTNRFDKELVLEDYYKTDDAFIFTSNKQFYEILQKYEKKQHRKTKKHFYTVKNPPNFEELYKAYPFHLLIVQKRGYSPKQYRFFDGARVCIFAKDAETFTEYLNLICQHKSTIFVSDIAPDLYKVHLTSEMVIGNKDEVTNAFTGVKVDYYINYVKSCVVQNAKKLK